MHPLILIIVALAVASFLMFHRGIRTNRVLAHDILQTLERTFEPVDTEYRNIGGTIGWHFTYVLPDPPVRKIRGLFTLVPRQAMFYMPIARMMKREDELHVSFYSEDRPAGEGHIVVPARLDSWWAQIEDQEEFDQTREERDGQEFVFLTHNRFVLEKLQWFLRDLPSVDGLRQFACLRQDNSYLLVVNPRETDIPAMLTAVRERLPGLKTHFG
jgi:hypothetical protein